MARHGHVMRELVAAVLLGSAAPTALAAAGEPPASDVHWHIAPFPVGSYGSDVGLTLGAALFAYRHTRALGPMRDDMLSLRVDVATRGPREVVLSGSIVRPFGVPLLTRWDVALADDPTLPYWGEGAQLGGLSVPAGYGTPPEPYRSTAAARSWPGSSAARSVARSRGTSVAAGSRSRPHVPDRCRTIRSTDTLSARAPTCRSCPGSRSQFGPSTTGSSQAKILGNAELRAVLFRSHLLGNTQDWGMDVGVDAGRAQQPGYPPIHAESAVVGIRLVWSSAVIVRVQAGRVRGGETALYLSFGGLF